MQEPKGSQLKQLREQAGYTLEEVSVRTRIAVKHLEALEEGTPMGLPQAYVRGYLRQYLLFLEVDRRHQPQQTPEETTATEVTLQHARRPLLRGVTLGAALLMLGVLASEVVDSMGTTQLPVGVNADQKLEIRPIERVHIKILGDNRLLYEGNVEPGPVAGMSEDGQTMICSGGCKFEAYDTLEVVISNMSLVTLRYNDKELKPLGAQSHARRLQFIDDLQEPTFQPNGE